ncbi:MAG: hypothetical protein Q7S75_02220 [bacterium]|nr:hypothetical protein [bacterium]
MNKSGYLLQKTDVILWRVAIVLYLLLMFIPSVSFAAAFSPDVGPGVTFSPAIDPVAAAQCTPVTPACPCGTVPSTSGCVAGPNKFMCPCISTSFFGLYTSAGTCTGPGVCTATGITPLATIGMGIISSGISGVVNLGLKALSGGGSTPNSISPTSIPRGCTYRYQVTVPSSDPCAIYVPSTSGSLNTSSQLLNALKVPGTGSGLLIGANNVTNPSIGNQLLIQANNVVTPAQNTVVALPSGAKGEIQLTSTGATIQAGIRDANLNTEAAGFFGSNAQASTPPQNIIERICLVRPWQNPLVSAGISASLFDNICSSKGFKVGVLPVAATPVVTAKPAANPPVTSNPVVPAPAGPYIVPQVSIWASPASVSVGSRTSIFWTARGVDSCIETSPDGSFNGNSLYGSSATVPISSATVFSISCVAPDGSHVTSSVTVNLSI